MKIKTILGACILLLIVMTCLTFVSAEYDEDIIDDENIIDAEIESFTMDSDEYHKEGMFTSHDVYGKIVINLSSIDDSTVELMEENYDKKMESDDIEEDIGDISWRIDVPGYVTEIKKVSSMSIDGDELTLDYSGLFYETESEYGGPMDFDKIEDITANITFYDEFCDEYKIAATTE